jgi:quaternary ammonium compound-resistance protein SugE
MAWLILIAAGLFEVVWAFCLKESRGFTRPWPTAGFVAFTLASVGLLGVSLKSLPLGTAYSVWTGIGAVGTVVAGIVWLGESPDPRRLVCVGLILAGILGLKWLTPG